MHLRLLQPPFGPERSTEVVVGARLVGVELDGTLEVLGGRARPAGLVEDGPEVRAPLRPAGRDLHRPVENQGRFLVAPLGSHDPTERLEHGGIVGPRLSRATHVNLGALELPA